MMETEGRGKSNGAGKPEQYRAASHEQRRRVDHIAGDRVRLGLGSYYSSVSSYLRSFYAVKEVSSCSLDALSGRASLPAANRQSWPLCHRPQARRQQIATRQLRPEANLIRLQVL